MPEEQFCTICSRSEQEVKLLDAIEGNDIAKICEECSILEDIPILRKPDSFQLGTTEKPATVYERLSKISGKETPQEREKNKVQEVMRKVTMVEDKEQKLSIKQRQKLVKKINQPVNLIDNYHWHIQMARRKRKISQKQLAENIGETEEIIKMIETKNLPDDAGRIIRKIEQYLSLKLEKTQFEAEQTRIKSIRQPSRILNLNQEKIKTLTISDLIKMKKQKEKIGEQDKQVEEAEEEIEQKKPAEPNEETEKKQQLSNKEQPTPTTQQSTETKENILGDEIEIIEE